jgi:hypothetical protein
MTKQFNSFSNFHDWFENVRKKTNEEAKYRIAKEVYIDGEKYIYIDTRAMYKTGNRDDYFKKGFVIIRKPQAKWLYYTTRIHAGEGNPKAIPQWWEAVKVENMSKYEKIYIDIFNKNKRG